MNIGGLLKELMGSYDCTKEVVFCPSCKYYSEEKKPSILIPDLKIVWDHNYKNLQEKLNEYFNDKLTTCPNCNTYANLKKSVGPYLWIDCDEVYRPSSYAKARGID